MAPGEPAETNTLLMDYVDYVDLRELWAKSFVGRGRDGSDGQQGYGKNRKTHPAVQDPRQVRHRNQERAQAESEETDQQS